MDQGMAAVVAGVAGLVGGVLGALITARGASNSVRHTLETQRDLWHGEGRRAAYERAVAALDGLSASITASTRHGDWPAKKPDTADAEHQHARAAAQQIFLVGPVWLGGLAVDIWNLAIKHASTHMEARLLLARAEAVDRVRSLHPTSGPTGDEVADNPELRELVRGRMASEEGDREAWAPPGAVEERVEQMLREIRAAAASELSGEELYAAAVRKRDELPKIARAIQYSVSMLATQCGHVLRDPVFFPAAEDLPIRGGEAESFLIGEPRQLRVDLDSVAGGP